MEIFINAWNRNNTTGAEETTNCKGQHKMCAVGHTPVTSVVWWEFGRIINLLVICHDVLNRKGTLIGQLQADLDYKLSRCSHVRQHRIDFYFEIIPIKTVFLFKIAPRFIFFSFKQLHHLNVKCWQLIESPKIHATDFDRNKPLKAVSCPSVYLFLNASSSEWQDRFHAPLCWPEAL